MIQCKDISDMIVVERIWQINRIARRWATWFTSYPNSVFAPDEYPDNLMLAKMRQLMRKELVDGCLCGCRGDYVVTRKGCELIGRPWHGLDIY